jgi:hypothetical protein
LRISGDSVVASKPPFAPIPSVANRARHQRRFRRMRRAELKDEVENVEELGRGFLVVGAQRLDEVDSGRCRRRWLAKELR